MALSFTSFTLIYGVLAVIELRLLLTFARQGLPDVDPAATEEEPDEAGRTTTGVRVLRRETQWS